MYFFLSKCKTSASPGCCVIWSSLHQPVIGEAIDHVAWTPARLCDTDGRDFKHLLSSSNRNLVFVLTLVKALV